MNPTLFFIPCFSGSPWNLGQLGALADLPLRTARLPEGLDHVDSYADFVAEQISSLDDLILVGDSFGALVGMSVAARRPRNLRGLVLSGGFAANPVKSEAVKLMAKLLPVLGGPIYRHGVLRYHASTLRSPHDAEGNVPWNSALTRRLFLDNTPHRSFVARTRAALSADLRPRLGAIDVPTLIITPSDDRLIGEEAAREMLNLIPGAAEIVLERTGHMFRFSHPKRYADTIKAFLNQSVLAHP